MGPPPPSTGAPGAARSGDLLAGRYRLDRPLATGGMARVWEARDEVLNRPVAVKILLEHLVEDASFVTRFRAEALAAARLTHPSVVSVYDTCSAPSIEAIVMELIDGETLRQRLDQGRLDEPEAARIGARIAEALAVAHRAGIVHRDIKPANVLLGSTGRVVVTDFGIAKAAEGADLTTGGQMLGTAKYLAPEQVEGLPVDGRADVYALGVVLYEAVCGRVPFAADTEAATALARLHGTPPPPRSLRPGLDPDLARIIERTLARERADRWPDAASLGRSLAALAAGRTLPPDPAGPPPPPRPVTPPTTGPDPATRSWRGPDDDASRSWRAPEPSRPAPSAPAAPPPRPAAPPPPRPAPPPPPAPRPQLPQHHAPARRRRRRGPTLGLIAVLGVSVLIIGALGWQLLGPGATETLTPTNAIAFDPFGPGDGERNDLQGLAVDGDPTTAWRTETYRSGPVIQEAANKPGVGLILELGGSRRLETLRITSPTEGWTAQAYVLDAVPEERDTSVIDDADPVTEQSDIAGDATLSLGGRQGSVVVLWITRTGDEGRVEVAEATVEVAA